MLSFMILHTSAPTLPIRLQWNRTHLWRHEAFGRVLSRPCDGPHPRARDEVKVRLPGRVKEGHLVDGAVVGGHAERDDLQLGQARRHREGLAAVRVLVNVPAAKSIHGH